MADLRSSLSYINAGSYLHLMLDVFYSDTNSKVGKESSNIANEAENVMKRSTKTAR